MSESRKPKIFISYSHESNTWRNQIQLFVNNMRVYGLDCSFDKYTPENPLWSDWMKRGIYESDYIFIFCTKSYKEKFIIDSPHKGSGVYAEAECIRDRLEKTNNEDKNKIFLLFFDDPDDDNIPTELSRCSKINCLDYEQLNDLYHRVTNQIENAPDVGDIVENLPNEILTDLKNNSRQIETTDRILKNLKQVLKDCVSIEELKLYATNLLNFNSIHLPDDFDSIVDHLYDHRKPLLCLLKQLDDNRLAIILKKLQKELHISDSKLENFDCMKKDMRRKRCNLLITLEPENDNIEHTKVEIWKDEKPYPYSVYQGKINLSNEKNPTGLVDEIFKHITVSSNNVLIEFIIPYELQNIDFSIWHDSRGSNLGRKFKIVRRLSERMEKSRTDDNAYEDWKKFWEWYQNKKSEKLKKLAIPVKNKNDIFFSDFEEKPYIKCKNPIDSEEMYKAILDETACIVLAPLKENNTVKQLCSKIDKKDKLENLIKASFRSLRDEVPYLLIWDNLNRIPKRYRHKNTKTSTEGE